MDEYAIVRSLLLRTVSGLPASAPAARAALEWAQQHAEWLLPGSEPDLGWDALLAGLQAPLPP